MEPLKVFSLRNDPTLLANARLAWKGLPGTNTSFVHTFADIRKKIYNTGPRRERHLANGGQNGGPAPLTPVLSCGRKGAYPPVERAVVRTFSIDKMRPVCPVCNPGGDTPYPMGYPQRRPDDEPGENVIRLFFVTNARQVYRGLVTLG